MLLAVLLLQRDFLAWSFLVERLKELLVTRLLDAQFLFGLFQLVFGLDLFTLNFLVDLDQLVKRGEFLGRRGLGGGAPLGDFVGPSFGVGFVLLLVLGVFRLFSRKVGFRLRELTRGVLQALLGGGVLGAEILFEFLRRGIEGEVLIQFFIQIHPNLPIGFVVFALFLEKISQRVPAALIDLRRQFLTKGAR